MTISLKKALTIFNHVPKIQNIPLIGQKWSGERHELYRSRRVTYEIFSILSGIELLGLMATSEIIEKIGRYILSFESNIKNGKMFIIVELSQDTRLKTKPQA